jgi:hypothetical protein
MNLADRTSFPLTNLQTGVLQMSVSADGSRMAVNSINRGDPDVFMIRSPMTRKKDASLQPNQWAQRRAQESEGERVPATRYVREMLLNNPLSETSLTEAVAARVNPEPKDAVVDTAKTTPQDTVTEDSVDNNNIDFRNYVFDSEVEKDSAFVHQYLDESKFDLDGNKTDDGRFIPKDYRLKFSTDLVYAGGSFSTYYGSYGLTQIVFSDLLGNHQIAFGSNLNLDLRNSTYFLQYGYLENRTNWIFNFFHNSSQFQDFSGRLYRFRSFGGAINARYPIDKFRRIDAGLSVIGLEQNYTIAFTEQVENRTSSFAYPQITFTSDKTLQGFITPVAGSRYSVSLTSSPPVTKNTLSFVSLLGDYRKYFNLGMGYSFAVRGSGAASFGRDSQTYFMGGMLGWINQRWSGQSIPLDRLGDTFFTLPALPLRGHPYNAIYGDRFSLINAEFRFPLFAAILPGPIPILPLYNLTGVAFVDAGMAWGQEVVFTPENLPSGQKVSNPASLQFELQRQRDIYLDRSNGNVLEQQPADYNDNPNRYFEIAANQGDILMGAGFGLRTILLGFPLRYDVGWPYYRDGFDTKPIHYVTIGIDF